MRKINLDCNVWMLADILMVVTLIVIAILVLYKKSIL